MLPNYYVLKQSAQIARYVFFDVIGSALAWLALNVYRKVIVETKHFGYDIPFMPDTKFWIGLFSFCLFWFLLFLLAGFYHKPYKKSRLDEFGQSFKFTMLGCIVMFFILVLDDYVDSYREYYYIFIVLFVSEFLYTYIARLIITTIATRKIHRGEIWFPTLIIGNGERASEFVDELASQSKSQGYKIIGFVSVSNPNSEISRNIPKLGNIDNVQQIIKDHNIQEVILATDTDDNNLMAEIINKLLPLNVNIQALPSLYDILSGRVKMSGILNAPLINVSLEPMPYWQMLLKRVFDYVVSMLALIILSPISLVAICVIKLTSKGPIIYKQERIGQYGKPFMIYKFRSMRADAEMQGPALSSKTDSRVTRFGSFMRKTHIDEIPNFVNVVKGDMSLVGPRPERQFYIDQIVKIAPHYVHLHKVKPGITSWGQVKYGYAENVAQMVQRLRYDMLYLDNMSLYVDMKILIYTLIVVFKGKGV